jgi:hypothetical protein
MIIGAGGFLFNEGLQKYLKMWTFRFHWHLVAGCCSHMAPENHFSLMP